MVVPSTLLIIFVLLSLTFKRFDEALLIMAALPFALVGGIWLLYLLSSVAVILAGLFSIMWGPAPARRSCNALRREWWGA